MTVKRKIVSKSEFDKLSKKYLDLFSIYIYESDVLPSDKRNVSKLIGLKEFRLNSDAGKYFKEWREKIGFTQDELAYACRVNTHTLSQFELGNRSIPFNTGFINLYYSRAIEFNARDSKTQKEILKNAPIIRGTWDTNYKLVTYRRSNPEEMFNKCQESEHKSFDVLVSFKYTIEHNNFCGHVVDKHIDSIRITAKDIPNMRTIKLGYDFHVLSNETYDKIVDYVQKFLQAQYFDWDDSATKDNIRILSVTFLEASK